jgi:hypothetical protein
MEWQLVLVCGRVARYTPAGSRWVLEVAVAGHQILVLGEPAAGISMSKSAVGSLAVVVGIVRRSSSNSSIFQMVPRTAADLRLASASSTSSVSAGSARASGSVRVQAAAVTGDSGSAIEIRSADQYVGKTVTVTGLVLDNEGGTATVDDGTGSVRVGGTAAEQAISVLSPGDAIEVTGVVARDAKGLLIDADPESIVDLPVDGSTPGPAENGVTQHLAGVSAAVATPVVPDAMRRGQSGTDSPLGGPVVLLLLATLTIAGAAVGATVIFRLFRSSRDGTSEGH